MDWFLYDIGLRHKRVNFSESLGIHYHVYYENTCRNVQS